jgi:hypothetical protein
MMDMTPTMSDSDLFAAARNMEVMGGSFAACIAQAFFKADLHNRKRLLYVFGDLFVQFAPIDEGETT